MRCRPCRRPGCRARRVRVPSRSLSIRISRIRSVMLGLTTRTVSPSRPPRTSGTSLVRCAWRILCATRRNRLIRLVRSASLTTTSISWASWDRMVRSRASAKRSTTSSTKASSRMMCTMVSAGSFTQPATTTLASGEMGNEVATASSWTLKVASTRANGNKASSSAKLDQF